MTKRPVPTVPLPGQESVWDFPRPPALRQSSEHLEIILGGVIVCDATTSWQYLETSHPPTYYISRTAFRPDSLRVAAGSSFCEWKGRASYLDLIGGNTVAPRAGWYYPTPTVRYSVLVDHVAVYPGAMDRCLVDGEEVVAQPGGFYGGWITSKVAGPFKGIPGSNGW